MNTSIRVATKNEIYNQGTTKSNLTLISVKRKTYFKNSIFNYGNHFTSK